MITYMEYKSQVGQDEWIIKMTNGKRNGYFLDIGASDGVFLSNTYILEKDYGWNGICVESDDDVYEKLISTRNCKCIKTAIYSENTTVPFVQEPYKGIKSCIQIPSGEIVKMVDAITLDKLMADNNVPAYIDYISLDIEGADYEALRGFPFDKYRVGYWTIENNAYMDGGALKDKIRKIMAEHGYKVVLDTSDAVKFFEDWFYE